MKPHTLIRLIAIALLVFIAHGCDQRGDVLNLIELNAKVSEGRLQWYYRGSDKEYHYIALVTGVPVPAPFSSEKRAYYRVKRPTLDQLLSKTLTVINQRSNNEAEWVKFTSRPSRTGHISIDDWHTE